LRKAIRNDPFTAALTKKLTLWGIKTVDLVGKTLDPVVMAGVDSELEFSLALWLGLYVEVGSVNRHIRG
jgi:hypothetical protein